MVQLPGLFRQHSGGDRKGFWLIMPFPSYAFPSALQSTGGSLFGLAPTLVKPLAPVEAGGSYVEVCGI